MLANFETPSRLKMLKVWGRRSSFNVQKVMWLIGELGLEHQHIDAGGRSGGLDISAFLAMNPHGRVPVIQDGDATVWESHAILRYLAARHGAGHFWSGDPAVPMHWTWPTTRRSRKWPPVTLTCRWSMSFSSAKRFLPIRTVLAFRQI